MLVVTTVTTARRRRQSRGNRQGRAFFDRGEGEELVWPSGRMLDESGRRLRRDEREFLFFFVEIKWLTLERSGLLSRERERTWRNVADGTFLFIYDVREIWTIFVLIRIFLQVHNILIYFLDRFKD